MTRVLELQQAFGEDVIRLDEAYVKKRSRDYYWYSPILKKQLDGYAGDCVAIPRDEEELAAILSFAVRYRIPVVPKRGGTGNYGQIIPLHGGIVLDTTKLNTVKRIDDGAGTFGAGIPLGKLARMLKESGKELRFFPSTYMKSTLAGFIAGGTDGVGSIKYGTLWDEGNVLKLTIMTMEEKPRRLTVRVSNPHTFLLEEGGKDDWIAHICQAKRENDPYSLLNPGKTKRMEVAEHV
ncbi:FAD-binding oxidoreductase [Domibacillus sp. A3M-37]|uniref:FAD-binding oxidoreductase n=1 Tax=Domibacillus sp. A3M-37 TaxID=2962037 RepID=UPI0020B901B7|nr:FAD-binding oxidoreductase [Domibacillus sp. A3M-37]MCP3760943.1 FAD-binding oxidoreductase [Domibacillus sp. A3M-37]